MVAQGAVDDVVAEATEAADQLPLSYPATLVATLPCTMPAWLAQSQRTAASFVPPTQLLPTQIVQTSVVTVRQPARRVTPATKGLLQSPSTGKVWSWGPSNPAAEKAKSKFVSRLSQLGKTAQEIEPIQATVSCRGADQQQSLSTAGQIMAAAPVADADTDAGKSDKQRPGLGGSGSRAAPDSLGVHNPAGKGSAAPPTGARAVPSSPNGQPAERGKRSAECSPGALKSGQGAHKRARSDSPTAKPDWQMAEIGPEQMHVGPSDADVQVEACCPTQQLCAFCLQCRWSSDHHMPESFMITSRLAI